MAEHAALPRRCDPAYRSWMRKPGARTTNLLIDHGEQVPLQDADTLEDDGTAETMSPEHRDVVLRGLEQSRRGDVATEEDVRAVFASFRQ